MSGHSKWSQIKHKKAITDVKRGRLFSKLAREVSVAARVGGASLDTNIRLRAAVERAKSEGLPKENIDRAIAKANHTAQGMEFKEFLYEASALGGISILIEGITDNTNRTFNEIKHLLSEHDGRMADPGSLAWNFEKIGILKINKDNNAAKSTEYIELAIIESGARDLTLLDDFWLVETEFTQRERIRGELEQKGIMIAESGHDYKSRSPISPDVAAKQKAETLLEELLEHDDVQEIYTNLAEDTAA